MFLTGIIFFTRLTMMEFDGRVQEDTYATLIESKQKGAPTSSWEVLTMPSLISCLIGNQKELVGKLIVCRHKSHIPAMIDYF